MSNETYRYELRGSETRQDHSKSKKTSRRFETFRDDLRRFDRLKSSRNVSNRLDGFFGLEWSGLVSDPLKSYRYVLLEIQSLKNRSYGPWKGTSSAWYLRTGHEQCSAFAERCSVLGVLSGCSVDLNSVRHSLNAVRCSAFCWGVRWT